jgi:hypothetical protein
MRRLAKVWSAALVGGVLVAACGGSDEGGSAPAGPER